MGSIAARRQLRHDRIAIGERLVELDFFTGRAPQVRIRSFKPSLNTIRIPQLLAQLSALGECFSLYARPALSRADRINPRIVGW